MDPLYVVVLLLVVAVVAYVFGGAMKKLPDAAPSDDQPSAKAVSAAAPVSSETNREELSRVRAQLTESERARERAEADLKKSREDAKEARQRAHDRGQQLDQIRKELESERARRKALGTIEATREEMLRTREENERLQEDLRRANARLSQAQDKPVEAAKEEPGVKEDSEIIRRYESILAARDAEFRRDFRSQNDELRASLNQQVSEERGRYKNEIQTLQGKVRTLQRDIDRERRRSTANDRAYVILKGQLESTLDRLALLDPSIRRPDALTTREASPSTPEA